MRYIVLLALAAASPCAAQGTTDCKMIGGTFHCQSQPNSGIDWTRAAQPIPDYADIALRAAQQGQIERERRQLEYDRKALASERATQTAALVDALPLRKPTPREVYIGCGLMLASTDIPTDSAGRIQPMSASMCRQLTTYYRIPKMSDPANMRACLPSTLQNPEREMAIAYLDFYDEYAPATKKADGPTAFDVALVKRWPCQ